MLARIYSPAKTAMQSGKAKTQDWVLEFEPAEARRRRSADGLDQLRRHEPARSGSASTPRTRRSPMPSATASPSSCSNRTSPKRIVKAYADNFAFGGRPWTH